MIFCNLQVGQNSQLPPCLAAAVLADVMKDSPQPHCPLEFGLINMNSELQKKRAIYDNGNRLRKLARYIRLKILWEANIQGQYRSEQNRQYPHNNVCAISNKN